MRIVKKVDRDGKPSRTVAPGTEDVFILFIAVLIIVGLVLGKITFQEALGYFGVTSAGGVWGFIGGNSSSK
jgi:hypothetical protein